MSRAVRGASLVAGLALLLAAYLLSRRASPPASPPVRVVVTARDAGERVAIPRPAAPPPATLARPATPAHVVTLGWGDGADQVGRRRDPEAAAEGPMSLSVGRDGTLFLLDQVNGRVLRRGRAGHFASPITIGAETAQDLRAVGDGVAVLDRLGERSLKRYDASGHLVDDQPLARLGIAEGGGVTGLYGQDSGELYVEESLSGRGQRVLRSTNGGEPLPGRPSRDGAQLLAAQIVRATLGTIVVRGLDRGGGERFATTLSVGRPVLSIALLDTDSAGGIYVGVVHAKAPIPPSRDLTDERVDLFRLDGSGRELAHLAVPHPPSALEQFRELEVAGVGVVWWMHPLPDDSGVVIDELKL